MSDLANLRAGEANAARNVGNRSTAVLRVQFSEVLLRQLHELLVANTAGACQHHARWLVVHLKKVDQLLTRHRPAQGTELHGGPPNDKNALDILRWTEDSTHEWRALISGLMHIVEDNLLQILFDLLHLTQYNALLALDRIRRQRAILQNVSKNLHHCRRRRVSTMKKQEND